MMEFDRITDREWDEATRRYYSLDDEKGQRLFSVEKFFHCADCGDRNYHKPGSCQ